MLIEQSIAKQYGILPAAQGELGAAVVRSEMDALERMMAKMFGGE